MLGAREMSLIKPKAPYPLSLESTLFVLFFVSWAYFFNGGGWNPNARMAQVYQVVENGCFHINAFLPVTKDISVFEGHAYPNKPPGSSVLGAIPYGICYFLQKGLGFDPSSNPELILLDAYLVNVFANTFLGALAAVYFFRLSVMISGCVKTGLSLSLAYGLGTLLFPYGTVYMGHLQAISLYVMGFYYFYRFFFIETEIVKNQKDLFWAGLWMGFSVTVDFLMGYLCFFCLFYVLLKSFKNCKIFFQFGCGLLCPAILLAIYQTLAFGNPFTLSMTYNNPIFHYGRSDLWLGAFQIPKWGIVRELLLGEFYGLFIFMPVLLFGVFGMLSLCVRGKSFGFLILAQTTLTVLANASFIGWWGGGTAGPRYLLGCVPLLLLCAQELLKTKMLRIFFLGIAALSFYFQLAICATTVQPGSVKSLRRDILTAFQEKKFASNPSFPRLSPQDVPEGLTKRSSFNLGQWMGLSNRFCLWPLLGFQFLLIARLFLLSHRGETGKTFVNKSFPKPFQKTLTGHSPCGHGE